MPGFYNMEERVSSLESTRNDGLGTLIFGINAPDPFNAAVNTTVPNGTNWTPLAIWQLAASTYSNSTASVVNSGRALRIPRRHWGDIVTDTVLSVVDQGVGGSTWTIALGVAADLSVGTTFAPGAFYFPPLGLRSATLAQNANFSLTYPNMAILPPDSPVFTGEFIDVAFVAQHTGGAPRTLTTTLANSIWNRLALDGNQL